MNIQYTPTYRVYTACMVCCSVGMLGCVCIHIIMRMYVSTYTRHCSCNEIRTIHTITYNIIYYNILLTLYVIWTYVRMSISHTTVHCS